MKYGLIGAGPVNQYLAVKLPLLSRELEWVAAINQRSASRMVNTLGVGQACALKNITRAQQLILICAPGDHFQPLATVLEKTEMEWGGKSLVLCQCRAFSRELDFIRSRGASVASMHSISGLPDRFVVEGDREALRAARYLAAQLRAAPIQIDPEEFNLYCAAQTLASSLFTPLLEGCAMALRGAGMAGKVPAHLVEAMFLHSIRTFLYSGRKSWTGTIARGDPLGMEREMGALEGLDADLANLYRLAESASVRMLTRKKERPEKV